MDESNPLDVLAYKYGTDKRSGKSNFVSHYFRRFGHIRNDVRKMLEIGVDRGGSIKMWADFFPNASIHGIDIMKSTLANAGGRITIDLLNQESKIELKSFIAKRGGDFDIIIDDGGHTMTQQINSFEALWPEIKNGGFYVIEDVETSYRSKYINSTPTAIEYFKSTIDDINLSKTAAPDQLRHSRQEEPYLYTQKTILSIEFLKNIIFIQKKFK